MAVVVENISFRTIAIVDIEKQDELTIEEKNLILDIYEHINHEIKISDKDLSYLTEQDMFNWCWDNICGNCYVTIYIKEKGNILARFEKEEDAMAFKLRWL